MKRELNKKNPARQYLRDRFSRIALAAVLGAAVMAATSAKAAEEKILNVFNWSEYIGVDTVKNFEKETGIKVRYDNYDSNEILLAKLSVGKTGYDIVVPSANWGYLEIQGGLLRKLDKSKLPNLTNLDPAIESKVAKLDPGNEYLVPWLWSYTTVAINAGKVKAALGDLPMPKNPWDLVFDPKYASKLKSCGISYLDSPSEILPAALVYVGKQPFSKSAADYEEAGSMLQKVRPYITLFSTTGYIADMTNGSLCVAIGWSGDMNVARRRAIAAKNGNDIVTFIPSTGVIATSETMAIPADAPHPENALLWMNYILRPEVQAGLTNKVSYGSPNLASRKFIRKDLLDDKTLFLSDADMNNLIPMQPVSVEAMRLRTRVFTKFKTGL